MAIQLNQVIPWGRTGEEYSLMFDLSAKDLTRGVLDCGGGPASFTAELAARGCRAVSIDPMYAFAGRDIAARFEEAASSVLTQVRATPEDWVWKYHRNPDNLLTSRRKALELFLQDYESGLSQHRYVAGELPTLPFATQSFGLAVCSHLLFLYSELLTREFHIRAIRELCRVAREVRVFPLLTLRLEQSPHLAAVRAAMEADGWTTQILAVDYELQRGGNQMLRIAKAYPSAKPEYSRNR